MVDIVVCLIKLAIMLIMSPADGTTRGLLNFISLVLFVVCSVIASNPFQLHLKSVQTESVWRPNIIKHCLLTKHADVEVSGQTVKHV